LPRSWRRTTSLGWSPWRSASCCSRSSAFAITGLTEPARFRFSSSCVTLVFAYSRPRVGSSMALLAAAVIMFFGPGWQDILWPFQIAWLIAVACGALIALDGPGREERHRPQATRDLARQRRAGAGGRRRCGRRSGLAPSAARALDCGNPVFLYVLWWLGYQHTSLVYSSLLLVPRFVLDSAAGVLSSLTGLAQVSVATDTGTYLADRTSARDDRRGARRTAVGGTRARAFPGADLDPDSRSASGSSLGSSGRTPASAA